MIGLVTDPADLGVRDAAAALSGRSLSSRELVEACLARIRERDGTHSFDGDPGSINAWVRVYEEDALAAAESCGRGPRAREDPPPLCGVPIGLKDLYASRGQAADRLEPGARRGSRARLRRLGAARRRRAWCCSATCTRTSSPPAARPTRSATRGRSTARPAARAAAPRPRSRPAWCPPRPARTRPARCASRPPCAARLLSSRPAMPSRSEASSR